MKGIFSIFILLLALATSGFSQADNKAGLMEHCSSFIESYDNGFIIAGYTPGWYNRDYGLIIKTDANGTVLWKKYIGDTTRLTRFSKIIRTNDDAFAVAGSSIVRGTEKTEPFIMKFNNCGEVEWCSKIDDGKASPWVYLAQLSDDNYVFVYNQQIDMYSSDDACPILKLDPQGNLLSVDTLLDYNTGYLGAVDLLLLPGDELLIPSSTSVAWPHFIKMNSEFDILWRLSWLGIGESSITDTELAADGSFYSSGNRFWYPNGDPAIMYKFKDGIQQWAKPMLPDSMSGSGPLCVNTDSTYIGIFESYSSAAGKYLPNMAVYDTSGIMLSRRSIPVVFDEVRNTHDGQIAALAGTQIYRYTYSGMTGYAINDTSCSTIYTYDSLCSSTIETDTLAFEAEIIVGLKNPELLALSPNKLSVWPVPANDFITIGFNEIVRAGDELVIINITGILETEVHLIDGQKELKIDLNRIPKGVYIIKWQRNGVLFATSKFIH
jgi:hypothetical protein